MKRDLKKCIDVIVEASKNEITPDQAKSLVNRMVNEVERPGKDLDSAEQRIREIGNELIGEDKLLSAVQRRNTLLTMFARTRVWDYTSKFPTRGEGLLAFMNGGGKKNAEGRYSVYYQGQALKGKYVGRLIDGLNQAKLMTEFKSGQLDQEVFKELWELGREGGKPGVSGSPKAQQMAKIINDIHIEMIDRENRAGGFVHKLEGYIMRQAHDPDAIRRAGGVIGEGSAQASFRVWSEFILPLLDQDKTFKNADDKMTFLQSAHEGILSGVHNRHDVEQVDLNAPLFKNTGALAKRVSAQRVLHFKDADAAYKYNQRFGTKEFRESVLRQIQMRSQAISLMENFGPNPERTFQTLLREFKNEAKKLPDDERHLKSLSDWRLEASFRELTGANDLSANPALSRIMASLRALTNMSKLGGATITALADKAFLQSEMSFQGMNHLDVAAKQFLAPLEGRPEGERAKMLNLMGAAVDGFIGSVVQRFSMHDNRAGMLFKMQSKFFELNGMSWWNDIHKGAAGELMAAHLADHANLKFDDLPADLKNVLDLYGIKGKVWDIVRSGAMEVNGRSYIAPDALRALPDTVFEDMLKDREMKITENNILRMRDEIDTRLRTYFSDRIDMAVPTPGNEERVYAHWNSQAGTPLGEAIRLIMMFKAMPITVLNKVVRREIYGRGAKSIMGWMANDRMGNFRMIQLIAMTALGGYTAGAIKDALKGRTPKDPTNVKTIQDAMLRGGGLGIYGDFLFNEYDRSYRSFLGTAAGPVVGQLDPIADIMSKVKHGENVANETQRLVTNNTPFMNLFWIRPALDYMLLWNIQEMANPGSLRRSERKIEKDNGQGFFIRPSEVVNQ